MIVTHKISLDLVKWGLPPCIDVMQDDKYSRNLEISLYTNGVPFSPRDDCSVLVRYKKSDEIGGAYDSLPDGTPAGNIVGNIVTAALAPQVCTVAGNVDLVISLISGSAELNSFVLQLNVHRLPSGVKSSREYINISGFVPQPESASVGQCLIVEGVNSAGKVTAVRTAEASGTAAIPENVVTCSLDGSTEDKDITPVNADTFGGELPEFYVKTSALMPVDIMDKLTVGDTVASHYTSCFRIGNLIVLSTAFQLSTAPAANSMTPLFTGIPIPISAYNFGTIMSESSGAVSDIEAWDDGTLYVRSGSSSVGTVFWRGQITYICKEETE